MKRILLCAVFALALSGPAFAQVGGSLGGPGSGGQAAHGEESAKYLVANFDLRLLSGQPLLAVINGLDEAIDSVTCTKGSNTWTLMGPNPDKSVPRNTREILSGRAGLVDVTGWSGYCPTGLVAHTQSMDVRGELNIPNDFNGSTRVVFWKRNAN